MPPETTETAETRNHKPGFAPVSVVIPAWRAAGTIERALKSVAGQTLRPAEVVVVDDGSDDGTAEAAEACDGRMNGIALKVVRQKNAGAGAARNRAIREAGQPVLAFLDADDEWLPEHLERSLAVMEAGGHALVAHNGWIVENGEATFNDCARRFRETADPYVALYRKGYLDTCTVVARRDAVVAAGGFDETLGNAQDFEMWLALLADPKSTFVVFDEPLCRYHVSPGTIMSNTERRLDCCTTIAVRWAPALRRRGHATLPSLWWRLAAIHHEAVTVRRARGETLAALTTLARLPLALVAATIRVLVPGAGPASRPRSATMGDTP